MKMSSQKMSNCCHRRHVKQQYIAVCVVLLPESIVALQESIGRLVSVCGPLEVQESTALSL